MAEEYCDRKRENEYSTDEVGGYIQERYCNDCELYYDNAPPDDGTEWEECDYSIFECPKLVKHFSGSKDGEKN